MSYHCKSYLLFFINKFLTSALRGGDVGCRTYCVLSAWISLLLLLLHSHACPRIGPTVFNALKLISTRLCVCVSLPPSGHSSSPNSLRSRRRASSTRLPCISCEKSLYLFLFFSLCYMLSVPLSEVINAMFNVQDISPQLKLHTVMDWR